VEDWYSVDTLALKELGFPSSFTRSTLVEILSERYPDHTWEKVYLLRGKYAQQKRLERAVASLFPVCVVPLQHSPHLTTPLAFADYYLYRTKRFI